jgi:hypothetical protein
MIPMSDESVAQNTQPEAIDRRETAYHEAGHAVAHIRGGDCPVASIVSRDETLGRVTGDGSDEDLVTYYAGYAASIEYGQDPAIAREMARTDFGLARDYHSQHDEAESIEKAHVFVRENWRAIELIAAELLAHEVLTTDELYALVEVADGEATMDDIARMRAMLADQIAAVRSAHVKHKGSL